MCQEIKGAKPNFYIVNSKDDVKNHVAQLIRKYTDEGIKKNQIVILTMKTIETSVLTNLTHLDWFNLYSFSYHIFLIIS